MAWAPVGFCWSARGLWDVLGMDRGRGAYLDRFGHWVTETALSTALNTSYMAEQLSIFGLVVGVALLLTGVGLVIVAFAVFGRTERVAETRIAPTPTPTAAG